jgi:hypothetical protein
LRQSEVGLARLALLVPPNQRPPVPAFVDCMPDATDFT